MLAGGFCLICGKTSCSWSSCEAKPTKRLPVLVSYLPHGRENGIDLVMQFLVSTLSLGPADYTTHNSTSQNWEVEDQMFTDHRLCC